MQQVLHLLIVDRDRCRGLATVHDSRWLLPVVRCPERTRGGPLAGRWLAERGLDGDVIGQWLGGLTPTNDAMDWLVVVDARWAREPAMVPDLGWVSLEQLKSSASVVDYQRWAVEKAILRDVPSIAGPFGSMTWLDEARKWVTAVVGPATASPICYKATPYEVVLGIAAARGPVYFKGLTGDRSAEATITSTLSAELPDSFARTLALERRADSSTWWLTEHCRGTTLAADLTCERATLVAAALGRVQQHFRDRSADLRVPDVDMAKVAAWASALVAERVSPEAGDRCDAVATKAQRTLKGVDLPRGWIPLDLDAGNVLVDNQSVRFIDLDDSYVGAVPLPLSTFLQRAIRTQASEDRPSWIDTVHRAYEESWTPHLDLRRRWSDIDLASTLIDCHLAWQRLMQKMEQGEVHGVRELADARTAQRLARAIAGGVDANGVHGSR
jgi:hypothetical protein